MTQSETNQELINLVDRLIESPETQITPEEVERFRELLKEYRVEKRINRPNLARLLGVTQGTVYRWETTTQSPPRIENLLKLKDVATNPENIIHETKTNPTYPEFHKRYLQQYNPNQINLWFVGSQNLNDLIRRKDVKEFWLETLAKGYDYHILLPLDTFEEYIQFIQAAIKIGKEIGDSKTSGKIHYYATSLFCHDEEGITTLRPNTPNLEFNILDYEEMMQYGDNYPNNVFHNFTFIENYTVAGLLLTGGSTGTLMVYTTTGVEEEPSANICLPTEGNKNNGYHWHSLPKKQARSLTRNINYFLHCLEQSKE